MVQPPPIGRCIYHKKLVDFPASHVSLLEGMLFPRFSFWPKRPSLLFRMFPWELVTLSVFDDPGLRDPESNSKLSENGGL